MIAHTTKTVALARQKYSTMSLNIMTMCTLILNTNYKDTVAVATTSES